MHFRQLRSTALLSLLVIWILVLSACQASPPAPTGSIPSATVTPKPINTATPLLPAPSSTVQPTSTPSALLAVDPAVLRGMQVDFWHPWRGSLALRVEEAARKFNQQNPWGMWVRPRPFYSSSALTDGVDAAFAQDSIPADGPELIAASPDQLIAWYLDGRLSGLNDYVFDNEWGFEPGEIEGFQEVFWKQDRVVGEQGEEQRVGIPTVRTGRVLIYNQTWANELGFNRPPASPLEFQEQVCAAAKANNTSTETDKHFTGGWLADADALTILSWFHAFGAEVLPETDDSPYTFQTPASADTFAYLRELLDDGCAWEGRNPAPYDYFSRRMALFYSGTLQDIAPQTESMSRFANSDRWLVLPFPAADQDPVVYSAGYSYGIFNATVELQFGSWLFIRWMSEAHNQALLAEVWPSFPVSVGSQNELVDYQQHMPWNQILPLQAFIQPAPNLQSWRKVHVILEDAVQIQLYRLPEDQVEYILPLLDDMTREVLLQERME
jgi:ABC-type glycerol-3-phosphate transport system substrate-binding protein